MSENKKIISASPKVRKLAREFGADIYQIQGSQREGRINEEDIKAFVKKSLSGNVLKRKEVTTEGGLNLKKKFFYLRKIANEFKKNDIRVSLFVEPRASDIALSKEIGADCVEIHTGRISNLVKSKKKYNEELNRIKKCSILANKLNIEVHAGHGLDYKTTKILTKIKEIEEFNIGHFIIGESIFIGLSNVIKKFKRIIKN